MHDPIRAQLEDDLAWLEGPEAEADLARLRDEAAATPDRNTDPAPHDPAPLTTRPQETDPPVVPARFQLHRDVDVSGVSGTGVVALGVAFPDGACVVRWLGDRPSTVVWPSVDDVQAIHGHGGATRIVWLDPL